MKNSIFMLTFATILSGSCSANYIVSSNSSSNYSDVYENNDELSYDFYDIDNQTYQQINTFVSGESIDYSDRYNTYKQLMNDLDNNEEEIVDMIKEDETLASFYGFVKFLFEKDDKNICEKFIAVILNNDIKLFTSAYKNGLEICVRSKNKSLSKKAKNILDYYSNEFSMVN